MKWRWAKDSWTSKEYTFATRGPLAHDKVQHFLGGFLFSAVSPFFSAVFWALWEVKDALVRWEDEYITNWPITYNWGGDGASWRDAVAAWAGVLSWYLIF